MSARVARRAVVLAGTRGLGAAAVAALRADGCHVVTCGRTGGPSGDGVRVLAADLARPVGVDRFLDAALSELGGIDVLVTNCGGPPVGHAVDVSDVAWLDAYDSVFASVVRSCRSVVPLMVEQRDGAVICVASTSALRPIPGLAVSNALRPAVVGFARSLAAEVAADGVRVNCVLPGPFDTERSRLLATQEGAEPGEWLHRRARTVPLGRLGHPDEFGCCVAFLARAGFITGTTVAIDGGMSLLGPETVGRVWAGSGRAPTDTVDERQVTGKAQKSSPDHPAHRRHISPAAP